MEYMQYCSKQWKNRVFFFWALTHSYLILSVLLKSGRQPQSALCFSLRQCDFFDFFKKQEDSSPWENKRIYSQLHTFLAMFKTTKLYNHNQAYNNENREWDLSFWESYFSNQLIRCPGRSSHVARKANWVISKFFMCSIVYKEIMNLLPDSIFLLKSEYKLQNW